MLREQKAQIIERLVDDLGKSTVVISTNFQGLSAKQMAELRNALRAVGADYHVVKNTLARSAAEKAGRPEVMDVVEGPVALAFAYDDPVALVKVLSQHVKSTGSLLRIRGALVGERVLGAEEAAGLAVLPTREILVGRLIGQLQSPLQSLHRALSFPLQGLVTVLQNTIQTANE